jgi:hypothetical protein
MGDHFQSVVVPSITDRDASARAAEILAWLVAEEIVSAERSDCVLGANFGHRPGCQTAKATGSVAVDLALVTNGVEISTERRVFHAGQGGFGLVCCHCAAEFGEDLDGWSEAVDEWFEDEGPGNLACPDCGAARPITDWKFEPVWAFGCVGFTFWNWPKLGDEFLRDFEGHAGAPVVLVTGKL